MCPQIAKREKSYLLVEHKLEVFRKQTLDALFNYLTPKQPRRYLYDLISDYPRRFGKGFRPSLCIATCLAFGGEVKHVLNTAAALELLHNAFLIHDDIEDGSELRRGQPTLHSVHGVPIAINVGDAMNVMSLRPLMDNVRTLGPILALRIMAEVDQMVRETVEGQAIELGWVRDNNMDLENADYLRMCLKKTCWYTTIYPCRLGALIATRGVIKPSQFDRFGYFLGVAFQIQDDLLNLLGEMKHYGKEIGGDIWEGKRTLILIHLIGAASLRDKRWLQGFLANSRRDRAAPDIHRVVEMIRDYGSTDYARRAARVFAGAALKEYETIFGGLPDSEEKRFIHDIILFMIDRNV